MDSIYQTFVVDLARQAGELIKKNFVLGMEKKWKQDGTPVTETDTAVNSLVIQLVKQHFPTHGVLGEEEQFLSGNEDYIWVLDPIDGTVPFSHGYPTFVFSLALTNHGKSILGVVFDPMMNRLAVAEKGKGAWMDGKKLCVSTASSLNSALINLDGEDRLLGLRGQLINQGAYVPTLYSAVYAGLQVAVGEFVGEVFEYPYPWDGAALKILVEEAGGKVTDLNGNEQRYDQRINGFVATNGKVHQQVLDLIKVTLQ